MMALVRQVSSEPPSGGQPLTVAEVKRMTCSAPGWAWKAICSEFPSPPELANCRR